MAEVTQHTEDRGKKSKLPLILGLVLALAGGVGGFWVVYGGVLDSLLGNPTAEDLEVVSRRWWKFEGGVISG